MINIFTYNFILRGLETGLIIALIAPLIGIFLVLKRYSLIADTLAHVSLTGIAIGLLLNINPLLGAILTTSLSSILIERLRLSKKVYGESALSIFLSGSLAIAIIIISVAHGFGINLFSYLFGSILTVRQIDVYTILLAGIIVCFAIFIFYKEFIFITFDEEAAKAGGIPVKFLNILLIILSAFTISLAIPVVGVLLVSALIVIPVITALQLKQNFIKTIIWAEGISLFSVFLGIIGSYYLNLPAGGFIVLITLSIFILVFFIKKIN